MLDKAVEFYQWLGNGACIYVCGDATNMANDVDIALRSIIQAQGDMSVDEASEYVDELKRNRRYLRDVYWTAIPYLQKFVQNLDASRMSINSSEDSIQANIVGKTDVSIRRLNRHIDWDHPIHANNWFNTRQLQVYNFSLLSH